MGSSSSIEICTNQRKCKNEFHVFNKVFCNKVLDRRVPNCSSLENRVAVFLRFGMGNLLLYYLEKCDDTYVLLANSMSIILIKKRKQQTKSENFRVLYHLGGLLAFHIFPGLNRKKSCGVQPTVQRTAEEKVYYFRVTFQGYIQHNHIRMTFLFSWQMA